MSKCKLCPKNCGADRATQVGVCGGGKQMKIAKFMAHTYEEPILSGQLGSGAIFFSGCPLKCVYCQNYKISSGNSGEFYSVEQVFDEVIRLAKAGVHNINLVSASHYLKEVLQLLKMLKGRIKIPIVYNSSGYERVEALMSLRGYVDIYLPDFKYYDNEIAAIYSSAADYRQIATAAIKEMIFQTGEFTVENGLMKRGVLIRHLVLPSHRKDSLNVLKHIADNFDLDSIRVSIMSQYTPMFKASEFKQLSRKITKFEYDSVLDYAYELKIKGFCQQRSSANEIYTPNFELYDNRT